VRTESAVGALRVARLADALGHVEHDRDGEDVELPGEGEERLARERLHVGGIDHHEATAREALAREEVQDVEGVGAGRLVDLAVADPPTAIFTSSDKAAFGVLRAARAVGLVVPRDLSVVGFDDNPIAATARVPLTTIRQPLSDMGRRGVELLVQQIQGKRTTPTKLLLPTELVERQSCRQTWLER
jgi:DNA-binding LacI/PurR family transcriptional regulator